MLFRLYLYEDLRIPVTLKVDQMPGADVFLVEDGYFEAFTLSNVGPLPQGTRLKGWLWTTGNRVVGHVHRVGLRDSYEAPLCGVLMDGWADGLKKLGMFQPGVVIVQDDVAYVRLVTRL